MASSNQCKLMMFPWLAFGHMLPFLELSKQLAAKGVKVLFVSTPRNLQRLPSISPDLSANLKLVAIPLPHINGLPENGEATIDLQLEQVQDLKKAYDMLQKPMENLLRNESPNFILYDFVPCWIPEIAAKCNVPCAYFSTFSAAALSFFGPPQELRSSALRTKPEDLMAPPNWFPFSSLVAHRPDQAAIMFRNLNVPDRSGKTSGHRWAGSLEGCDFVAIRSCPEFEDAYLKLLQELYQKPVLPVGLLTSNLTVSDTDYLPDSYWCGSFKWLDQQEQKSVVFVAFGSEYKMPAEQIQELACGLELSEQPFLWTVRKPEGVDISDLLPNGFLARTSGRGIVSLGWASQRRLLAHPAIGGCILHCGWSSTIETLGFGHPTILMPMMADQGLNAKLLIEQGVGFEVPRYEDGSFDRYAVAKTIKLVMVGKEGEQLRLKAAQMPEIFANPNLHEEYISKFVKFLVNYKKQDSNIPKENRMHQRHGE